MSYVMGFFGTAVISDIAYRSKGGITASAGTLSRSPALPAVNGQNGILLAVVASHNNVAHTSTTPGWTQLDINNTAAYTASLWIAGEDAAAPKFTWPHPAGAAAQIFYYSEIASIPILTAISQLTTNNGTSSPHTGVAFTSDANGVLALYVDSRFTPNGLSTPAGWTEDSDNITTASADGFTVGSKTLATSGTSSGAISATTTAGQWVVWQLQLKT